MTDEEPSTEVQNLLLAGRKIDAIKRVREEQNLDLKEAKELVEAYVARHPERFPEPQSASSGGRFLMYAAILLAMIYTYQHFFTD